MQNYDAGLRLGDMSMTEVRYTYEVGDDSRIVTIKRSTGGGITIIEKKTGPTAEVCFDGPNVYEFTISDSDGLAKLEAKLYELRYAAGVESFVGCSDNYLMDLADICDSEQIPYFDFSYNLGESVDCWSKGD